MRAIHFYFLCTVWASLLCISLGSSCCPTTKTAPKPEPPAAPKANAQYLKLLDQADSLFKHGKYEKAKKNYAFLRDSCKDNDIAAIAFYNYCSVTMFYDNPRLDYDSALVEFKRFRSLYPSSPRINDANNWVKILTLLQKSRIDVSDHTDKIKKIETSQKEFVNNLSSLHDAYSNCDAVKDSLIRRVKEMEKAIDKLMKTE
ncbi:MAG: hypothetical protein JW795_19920 [Chitinivibrionales bacterium]|nr:hypothetical protein [Chitinivibrionales bacterium]